MNDSHGLRVIIGGKSEPDPVADLAKAIIAIQEMSFNQAGLQVLLTQASVLAAATLGMDLIWGRITEAAKQ